MILARVICQGRVRGESPLSLAGSTRTSPGLSPEHRGGHEPSPGKFLPRVRLGRAQAIAGRAAVSVACRGPVATPPQTDGFPAWSPDGSRIAFIRQVSRLEGERVVQFDGFHLLDPAGADPKLIPLGDSCTTDVRQPAWSSDGRKLYITAPRVEPPGATVICEEDLGTGRHLR